MCGIVATFAYSPEAPNVSPEEVLRARDAMASRGPDGAGYWESPDHRVALGHRRLSIIDVSERSNQPMASAGGRLRIVFNGEIYNYRELKAGLLARGHVFRTDSDTEVLLALYRERGASMVDALRGMYAFAVWDEREKTLFAARDPLGIKPLYVADDGRTIRIASQVKALLAGGGVDTSVDSAGHVGFFVWGCVPEPFTLYRGISAVPAGGSLLTSRNGFVLMERDMVREAFAAPSGQGLSPTDLRDALSDAVRHHLVSDVPVGLFLSAGRDSGSLGALAIEEGWTPRTLTLGFDELAGSEADEVPLAELMARALGARHRTVRTRRPEFEQSLEQIFAAMDQPSTDGVNTWLVARAAQREGWKVVLSGLGGDELFGGYPSFSQVPRSAAILRTFQGWPEAGRLARRALAPLAARFTSPKYASLFEYGGSIAGAYLLRRALHLPWELESVLDGDVLRDGWERLGTLERLEKSISGIRSPHAAVAALEAGWYMRNQLLRDADWAGMGNSLEIRVPLVDAALFQRMAPEVSGLRPPTKDDLAAAAPHPLPDEIRRRRKTGFVTPVKDWIRRSSEPEGRGLRGWALEAHAAVAGPAADGVLLRPAGHRGATHPTPISIPVVRPGAERVLVSTLFSPDGGVSEMLRFATRCLVARGYEPVLAYYMPWSLAPELSVPAVRALQRRVGARRTVTPDGFEAHEMGALLPELEFTTYRYNEHWQELVESCNRHIAVSGNFMATLPLAKAGVPFAAWLATPWLGDRKDRVSRYVSPRRALDAAVVRPIASRLERDALRKGHLVALSEYARDEFDRISGHRVVQAVLPVPVDTEALRPEPDAVRPFTVMFAGRMSDPRKNAGLFLEALERLRTLGHPARGLLVGGRLPATAEIERRQRRLGDALEVHERLSKRDYQQLLESADVFFVPSHQEGLCIAALEAMACGCPVVSTRCGGPEEFVRDGETGYLTAFDPAEAASLIVRIAADRRLRDRLGANARELVKVRYSVEFAERTFAAALDRAFAPGSVAPAFDAALSRVAAP